MEAQGPSREAAVHTEIGRTNSAQLTLPEGSSSVPRETEAARPPPWRGVVEVGSGAGGAVLSWLRRTSAKMRASLSPQPKS